MCYVLQLQKYHLQDSYEDYCNQEYNDDSSDASIISECKMLSLTIYNCVTNTQNYFMV